MISDVYFPRVNGVSTSIQTFIECFQALGHEVTLIAPQYSERVFTTFDLISIPSRALPLDPEDRLMSYLLIKELRHQLAGQDFDVVHIHTPFVAHYAGIYLAKIFGLKVIATYHTFFEAYFEQYLPWLPKSLLRYLARRISRSQCNQVDTVISPSRQMKKRLLDYGITSPIEVIPTGLPSICFETVEDAKRYRTNWGIPDDSTVLLYVGRVAFEKNIGLLIDAFELLAPERPEVFLLIAGEGPAEGQLKRYASQRDCHAQIKFTGYLDRNDELWRCYQSADCFVFGSKTETQGLVLLEALAAGLPVVSVASMGSKDVLVEGEGCRIVENDPNDFARTLGDLIDSPDDLQSLSVRARSYAKSWDAMHFATVLLEVLRRYKDPM